MFLFHSVETNAMLLQINSERRCSSKSSLLNVHSNFLPSPSRSHSTYPKKIVGKNEMKCHLNTICFAYSLISETDTHSGEILCSRRFGESTKRIKHFIHKHAASFADDCSSTSYSMQKGNKNKCILCSHTMQIDHRGPTNDGRRTMPITNETA